jgi:hypothetical protein
MLTSTANESSTTTPLTVAALALAAGIGVMTALLSSFSAVAMVGAFAALIAGAVCLARPRLGFYGFLFLLLVMDEFPSLLGEVVERSMRTPFYSKSLGVGGVYVPDVLLVLLIGAHLFHAFWRRRSMNLVLDRIGMAILVIAAMMILSAASSLVFDDALAPVFLRKDSGLGFDVKPEALALVSVFQFKQVFLGFFAYLLGQMALQNEAHLDGVLRVMGLAALAEIGIGAMRFASTPTLIGENLPLFYDSPSSLLFALVGLYTLGAWAYGGLKGWRLIAMCAVSAVLMFYVLVSFRRTMWAAIALAFLLMLIWMPRLTRSRLLIIGSFLTLLVAGVVALTPLGASLVGSIMFRLEQTNVHDPSTLARLAIAVRVYQMFPDLPVLGFGVKPIWNEIASLGYFETSLENVHSLYYWWLLRTGYAGIGAMAVAFGLVASTLWRSKNQAQPRMRVLALCLMLGYLMVLVSGIFNPVYAETRYTVLVGIGLAITSRLLSFARSAPPSPSARQADAPAVAG